MSVWAVLECAFLAERAAIGPLTAGERGRDGEVRLSPVTCRLLPLAGVLVLHEIGKGDVAVTQIDYFFGR
ncbi:hypothetical protein DKM19_36100 [Streptosporangium sp. 'caverna']|nr:hypothetical protein DKM19_36100 [Streptosporangium sp. 'caverna']